MNRSRVTGDLASQGNIFVDIANDRVGIGSTIPTQKLDVTGTVKATTFVGDGSSLTGIDAGTLKHNNNTKAQATAYGVEVTGTTDTDGLIVSGVSTFSNRATITHDLTISGTAPRVIFTDTDNNPDYRIDVDGGSFSIQDTTNGNANRFVINNAGNVTVPGNFDTVGNIAGFGDLTLTDTTADSAAGPEFKLFRNSASPADADYLGQIKFAGESDTGVERNYAKITGKILDASNGTEDGILEFAHIKAGSQTITGRWRSDSLQLLNDTNLTVDGNITVNNSISLNSDDSSPARIDLYCEVSNAHYTRLQAPAHSTYSGNVTVTIPNASGNLAVLANAANNRIVTATGTHAMSGESNLTYDGTTLLANKTSGVGYIASKGGTSGGDYGIVQVQSGSTVRGRLVSDAAVDAFRLDSAGRASAPITFHTGSSYTERLRISSVGELTSTATQADVATFTSNQSASTIYVKDSDGDGIFISGSSAYGHRIYTNTTENLLLGTNSTERFRITSGGKIGVNYAGTPPSETMMISSGDSTTGLSLSHLSGGNRYGFRLSTLGGTDKGLIISPFFNSGYTETLRIASDGDVTITATGDPTLKVIGPGQAQLTLTSTSGTDHCSINFGDSSDHDAGEIRYTNSSDSMNFDTAGAARMILDSSGNLYPNNDGDQSLGQSSNRWRNLFLRQGGQIQIGDATNTNFFGITEGLVNTYTDQDFLSLYYRNTLRIFSNNNNERVRFDASGNMTLYNGNITGNSSHTMEIGHITNGAVKRIRMAQGGEIHFGDTTSSNFMGITEGTVNQFSDVDNIGIYYRNSLKFFSNNNVERLAMESGGHFRPSANNVCDLGTTALRWRNIYTNDLQLSNEGNANEVDGTWGQYTIQEGEHDLFLINRRSGKRYKFNLTEVS